jgi:hypothetical protein
MLLCLHTHTHIYSLIVKDFFPFSPFTRPLHFLLRTVSVLYFALCFLFLLLVVIGHFKTLSPSDVSKFMSFEE